MAVDPELPSEYTRIVGRSMAPLWLLLLSSTEVNVRLERLGLEAAERYFAARAAPLGAAPLPLVVATFFNFSPAAVARAIPAAWTHATPAQVLQAQLDGVDAELRRAFADLDHVVVEEAADLMRIAALAACERPEGRPLFAAYASLPWPGEPHLDLWHAHYLLREFRGDGHIAVLTAEGLGGIDALALHIALMPALATMFRASRGWSDDEWTVCVSRLSTSGWLAATEQEIPTLTDDGATRRAAIEARTDELDRFAWSRLGRSGCERVVELAVPIRAALDRANLGFDALVRARPSASA